MEVSVPLAPNLLMFRSQVSCSRLLLEVGGLKINAQGGAELQPSCIPGADALL